MSRSLFIPRKVMRLMLFKVLPLGLIVIPSAVLINVWAYFGHAAYYQKAFSLCVSLVLIGLSFSALVLPEILRVTNKKLPTLIMIVMLLVMALSLFCSILVQVLQHMDLQTVMLLAILAAGVGLLYSFRNWANWMIK
jgi:hypothetical protein